MLCQPWEERKTWEHQDIWEIWYLQLISGVKTVAALFYRLTGQPLLTIWSLGSTRPFRVGPSVKWSYRRDKMWSGGQLSSLVSANFLSDDLDSAQGEFPQLSGEITFFSCFWPPSSNLPAHQLPWVILLTMEVMWPFRTKDIHVFASSNVKRFQSCLLSWGAWVGFSSFSLTCQWQQQLYMS